LTKEHDKLGDLVAIDGSLINAVLSMHWADYRKGAKKAIVHLGFDMNRSIGLFEQSKVSENFSKILCLYLAN